jgi:hypothetical protein
MPMGEQFPDTSILLDQDLASGSTSSFSISHTCSCYRDCLLNKLWHIWSVEPRDIASGCEHLSLRESDFLQSRVSLLRFSSTTLFYHLAVTSQ